jgi:hypothetical protein
MPYKKRKEINKRALNALHKTERNQKGNCLKLKLFLTPSLSHTPKLLATRPKSALYSAQSIAMMTLIKPWSSSGLILDFNNSELAQLS